MAEPSLSYIICTKNRLSYLKILFGRLLPQIKPGEEIVVVDGDSTDGSQEYLQSLYDDGKVHQFISEPDKNQAHGWNKALLMARGQVIKKLLDDDVPCINAIQKCCTFMLQNGEIDICISDILKSDLEDPSTIRTATRLPQYEQWKEGKTGAFTFSDVSMLQRRSSLSYIGLYDTQFKMLDWEYSLRASYLKACIAYYTGYNALAVHTPGNVTSNATLEIRNSEESIGMLKYGYKGDFANISRYSKAKIWVGETRDKLIKSKSLAVVRQQQAMQNLDEIYASYYQKLDEQNEASGGKFIV